MKKTAVFLVLCCIAGLLSACSNATVNAETTAPQLSSTEALPNTEKFAETEPLTDEKGYLIDRLSNELNFGNENAKVLYWNDVEHTEFEVEKPDEDRVNDSIYYRNRVVEERLKLKLEYVGIPGNVNNIASFVSHVESTLSAGETGYDIIGSYSSTGGTMLYSGLLNDLLKLEHLDLDMPWWPKELVDTMTLKDRLYICSGDISTNLLHMMYATFFNRTYLTTYGLENPYDLVDSGRWTYEEFEKMATGIYSDLDGDGKKSDGDRFGYATYWLHLDGLFGGIGIKSVEKDENDMLIISPGYGTERTQSFLEYINGMFNGSVDWYYLGNSGAAGKMQQKIFADGHSLFLTERVRVCQNVLRFCDTDYGILPMPKLNSTQNDYITPMAMPFSVYSVPVNAPNTERSGALLECLASEGYRRVTPELFEVAMKIRYSKDNVSSRMYDLVRDKVTFDLGRIFNESLGKLPNKSLRDMVQSASSSWMSKFNTIKKQYTGYLDKINGEING